MVAQVTPAVNGTHETPRPARPALAGVATAARPLPNRLCLYAREGWGKTSFAAHAPGAIFLMTPGEDGLLKLMETAQVGPVAHFEQQARSWTDLLARLDDLAEADHSHRVCVIDTVNGAYNLLFASVVAENFGGNLEEAASFGGEQAGKIAKTRLRPFIDKLDRLRTRRGMAIVLLSHADISKTPNPAGLDYDRWTPSIEKKHVWPEIARWCDLVLFGTFEVGVSKAGKMAKAKAVGGTHRVLKTQAEAWFDAKNRHGLSEEIDCGDCAADAWAAFARAMRAGRGETANA